MPEIRPFDPDTDTVPVAALWRSVFGYKTSHNDPVVAIARKCAHGDGLFFVACEGSVLRGTAMAGYDGHRGWIYAVAVDPAHQRTGIGRALVEHAEHALARLGCLKINLQITQGNEAVVGFYSRLGYVVEPRVSMGKVLPGNLG